jgi:hypothetical protein
VTAVQTIEVANGGDDSSALHRDHGDGLAEHAVSQNRIDRSPPAAPSV